MRLERGEGLAGAFLCTRGVDCDTTVLLVETSAPLRFPNSYSASCELQGRRSVRY